MNAHANHRRPTTRIAAPTMKEIAERAEAEASAYESATIRTRPCAECGAADGEHHALHCERLSEDWREEEAR